MRNSCPNNQTFLCIPIIPSHEFLRNYVPVVGKEIGAGGGGGGHVFLFLLMAHFSSEHYSCTILSILCQRPYYITDKRVRHSVKIHASKLIQ